jgi:hypothetical protein
MCLSSPVYRNSSSYTPLGLAVERNSFRMTLFLLEKGGEEALEGSIRVEGLPSCPLDLAKQCRPTALAAIKEWAKKQKIE